ncbi:arsenate reductase ArsC [Mucisphaera calidilacus]|uniref:Protein ArsC n=1 Tax=Mucisphaera calidilacus TaxID=2527982 RepID=A0A518BXW4_9BACT|nr:arsenate reductase ArsC [Mucisphaera calidilacus]QDU71827.1 Protein ArsC [Mucisphaera calidilacus]
MVAGEANNPYPTHNPQTERMRLGNQPRRVLILSRNNRCRSQMLDAWIRHIAGPRLEVVSAGIMPDDLHPLSVEVMFEVGMDISTQKPTDINDVITDNFEFVITIDDYTRDNSPAVTGARWKVHHAFRDPDMVPGDDERRLGAFRMTRDEVHDWAKTFVTWAVQQPTEQQAVSA